MQATRDNKFVENKDYVTAYAFGVSDDLIGKPLAKPGKRALAMIIDLVCIAVLSIVSTSTFFIVSGLACSFAAYKAKTQNKSIGLLLGISMFCFLCAWLSTFIGGESSSTSVPSTNASLSVLEWLDAKGLEIGLSLGWAALYFTFCTAYLNGQTLGKLICGTQVVKINGKPPSLWESFERYGGYSAGFATGLLGFAQVFWDANRQSIHDKVAETVVLDLRKPAGTEITGSE